MIKKQSLLGICASALIGITGCKKAPEAVVPSRYHITEHPADQVFRDHKGYRIYFTNGNEEIIEKKYMEPPSYHHPEDFPFPIIEETNKFKSFKPKLKKSIRIFKDLPLRERGKTIILKYSLPKIEDSFEYIEIHLPRNAQLSPGNEVYGGKAKINDSLEEIK